MSFLDFHNSQTGIDAGFFEEDNSFAPIPKDTQCLAVIEAAAWAEYNGEEYINTKWRISQPEAYNNRLVWQKLRILDSDPAKKNRAERMLSAIAVNANNGAMIQAMIAAKESNPSNNSLAQLNQGFMVIKLGVWENKETNSSGNFIVAVAKHGGKAPAKQAPATKTPAPKMSAPATDFDFDELPF